MRRLAQRKGLRNYSTIIGSEEVHGRFNSLVRAFRTFGHYETNYDPLDIIKPMMRKELNPSLYGFKVINNELFFDCDGLLQLGGKNPKRYANLMEILEHLREVYCKNVASIFMHLDTKEQNWIARELESTVHPTMSLTPEEEKNYYKLIQESELFDQYLGKKFPNTKRYGLEGAESAMVAIDKFFETVSKQGLSNVVIGMPHRGRLNMMTGLLNYRPATMFNKIRGNSEFPPGIVGIGDVLSHLGITTTLTQYGSPVKVSLLNNPSHLEAVNPVAMGKTRAKIEDGKGAVCLLVHGDSAFAGQGIVMETLGLTNLPYFSTKGTIHIILNNQLGFTTPKEHTRSSRYSADVGKMIDIPLFVVHGEKVADIARVIDIAVRYRQKFGKDVIIEIVAYRAKGHNELDEPGFTQPFMYKIIRSRQTLSTLYGKDLIEKKVINQSDIDSNKTEYENKLDKEFHAEFVPENPYYQGNWTGFVSGAAIDSSPVTGYDVKELKEFAVTSVTYPKHFAVHSRLLKYHIEPRLDIVKNDKPLDWATVEAMAFASIVKDGFKLRLCGQDVGRGTFSQRHLVIANQDSTEMHQTIEKLGTGKFQIVPSPLSEFGPLGFEYGYTIDDSKNISIWEAQFGDFSLSAQTVIDQFIVSGEDKWNIQSSLVMLLPHGFDGAGPEHSSCRIERYLQLTDGKISGPSKTTNFFVINPTTPANYFHALRRQIVTNYRKPLIIAGPKTLLRLAKAVSTFADLAPGTKFQPILVEDTGYDHSLIIICSGKIYYELDSERSKLNIKCSIIRLEELNPFPFEHLELTLSKFKGIKKLRYVQEEPENQGAFTFVKLRMQNIESKLGVKMEYTGRDACSSPATGISTVHKKELSQLFKAAFE